MRRILMLTRLEQHEQYRWLIDEARKVGQEAVLLRELVLKDLFFLLIYILDGLSFADNDWVYERCREFEADPDGYLDLWPREHFKSTIITLAAVIQRILRDPELTVGIFSYNRPIAKGFLRQIKMNFESNAKLRSLFPDILWENPQAEAPKWSEDDGIVVKRKGFPKEMTVEAWGVIDGMPTSKHYGLCVYDDVETKESVGTPENIAKVTEAVSISFNLGKEGGSRWMLGTIYHYASTYHKLIQRGAVKPRIYGATKDGEFGGEPWLWTRETLERKIREQGTYVASCQLFNKPVAEGQQTFKLEWLRYWVPRDDNWQDFNRYLLVDPSGEKKKDSDYTVMAVLGLGADHNYYLLDMIRDKLSLSERADRLFALHARYRPIFTGYEKYGMQSDIEYMKLAMEQRQYRFQIDELGGGMHKRDRIKRIQPMCEAGQLWLPERLIRVDYQGLGVDLVQSFINDEYLAFPYMVHDDMLDCLSRIMDEKCQAFFPSGGLDNFAPWAQSGRESVDEYSNDTYAYGRRR
jgi:phage terminase large subunit-like protein